MPERAVNTPAADPEAIVHDWLGALNRRDLEAILGLSHDQIELRPLRLAGFEPRYLGHAELRRWFDQLQTLGPEQQIRVDELRTVGETEVVVIGSLTLGTGGAVLGPFVGLHRVSSGRIAVARHYLSDPDLIAHLGII